MCTTNNPSCSTVPSMGSPPPRSKIVAPVFKTGQNVNTNAQHTSEICCRIPKPSTLRSAMFPTMIGVEFAKIETSNRLHAIVTKKRLDPHRNSLYSICVSDNVLCRIVRCNVSAMNHTTLKVNTTQIIHSICCAGPILAENGVLPVSINSRCFPFLSVLWLITRTEKLNSFSSANFTF